MMMAAKAAMKMLKPRAYRLRKVSRGQMMPSLSWRSVGK